MRVLYSGQQCALIFDLSYVFPISHRPIVNKVFVIIDWSICRRTFIRTVTVAIKRDTVDSIAHFSEQVTRKTMSFAGLLDMARKDVDLPSNGPKSLIAGLHSKYIRDFEANKESYLDELDGDAIVQYVMDNWKENGGFAPAKNHDAHLLHTMCAIQLLHIFNAVDRLTDEKKEKTVEYIRQRQNEDGSFCGDESNEVDTRFSLCALGALYLLDRLDAVDIHKAADFIIRCHNADGGFGTRPGSESHSAQVYCSVGSLLLAGRLDSINKDKTAEWLAFRQCASGGLNGRPEKLPDVCYSWWVMASLAMLGRLNWIDKEKLSLFIYGSQDTETGGFSDRPGDYPDPFHTIFGLAALSLLGEPSLRPVDPVLCMTKRCLGNRAPF